MSPLSHTGCWSKGFPHRWRLSGGFDLDLFPSDRQFREGFNSVFPLASLGMFYPDELDQIFCGTVQTFTPWDFKMLSDSCKPAHGFTLESPAIVQLFEILASYNQDEQRAFLQFVTGTLTAILSCLYSLTSYVLGCPRLPIGSFKSLTPPLTIVKKSFDTPEVKLIIINVLTSSCFCNAKCQH